MDYVEEMDKGMVNRMIGYLAKENQRQKTDNECLRIQNKEINEQLSQMREV